MGLNAFAAAGRMRDIRNRLLWVFGLFAVFVLMVHVPVPGVNIAAWNDILTKHGGDLVNFLGMFTGGALTKFSIGAMGITPYINASIIMQLLTHVIPALHDLQKEGGDVGRRQIAQYVRYGTVGLAILQATMMSVSLGRLGIFYNNSWQQHVLTVLALVAGTAFLMWLGEQITDKGIGNGVSLIIFAGIVLSYPGYVAGVLATANVAGPAYWISILIFLLIFVVLVAGIVALTQGQRKIPVQYAKRQVGRRVYGGQNTYIPIRVNNAGVISIIFAISIMYLPSTLLRSLNPNPDMGSFAWYVMTWFSADHWFFNVLYAAMVVFFTYFYAGITFNPIDIADNMKKYGGFIPGIRPGRPTSEYLEKILSRVTFVAAVALALIAILPGYVVMLTGVQFYLGSTSLLIIVGVALDTMQQIEARLVMRNYQGFMK